MPRNKSIALIGFMGSGKSTIGPLLAASIDLSFIDLDHFIAEKFGSSVSDIFGREGEDGWRRKETAALKEIAEIGPVVLGCGGGVVLREGNRALLKREFLTLYLRANKNTLIQRLRGQTGRPLLDVEDPEAAIDKLYGSRLPTYSAAADITVSTDDKNPGEVAREAAALIKEVLACE